MDTHTVPPGSVDGADPLVTGIVLAGGRSSRMGEDKARMRIGAETLAAICARQLRPFTHEILLSVGDDRGLVVEHTRQVPDLRPGEGPVMAIYSALLQSRTSLNIVIACDMPQVPAALIQALLDQSPGAEVVMAANAEGKPEPLCTVYRREIAPRLAAMLDKGERRASNIAHYCITRYVQYGPDQHLPNLNTPSDFRSFLRKAP